MPVVPGSCFSGWGIISYENWTEKWCFKETLVVPFSKKVISFHLLLELARISGRSTWVVQKIARSFERLIKNIYDHIYGGPRLYSLYCLKIEVYIQFEIRLLVWHEVIVGCISDFSSKSIYRLLPYGNVRGFLKKNFLIVIF